MRSSALLIAGFTALVVGCGHGVSPMDSAQKDRFRTTLGHVASLTDALASGQTRSLRGHRQLNGILRAFGTFESADTTGVEKQKIQDALSAAMTSHACTEKDNFSSAVGSSGFTSPLTMTINGDRCPIDFTLSVTGTATKTDYDLQFELGYSVKSDDFRALADIDGFSMKGSLSGSSNAQSTNVKLSLDGNLHSRTEKDLGIYIEAEVNGAKSRSAGSFGGSVAFGIRYDDFTGELKVSGDSGNVHYYVSDEEVTASEFQSYLKDFKTTSIGGAIGD